MDRSRITPALFAPLLDAAHTFLAAPDQETLHRSIVSQTAHVLGVPEARLVLANSDDNVFDDLALMLGILTDEAAAAPDVRGQLDAFYSLEGVAFSDDRRQSLAAAVQSLFGPRTAMLAPVRAGSMFVGVLAVLDHPGQRQFDHAEAAVLCELAAFAGAALRAEEIARDREARDGLTGLFDQASLRRELRLQISRRVDRPSPEPLALVLFDIDFFKRINDQAGHSAGDAVLRQVSAFVSQQSRRGDLAVRYGGEEFAVLMPGAGEDAAWGLAERLRGAVQDVSPGEWSPWPDTVTISCGVAHLTGQILAEAADAAAGEQDPSVAETAMLTAASLALINAADGALYESKRTGRNRSTRASDLP